MRRLLPVLTLVMLGFLACEEKAKEHWTIRLISVRGWAVDSEVSMFCSNLEIDTVIISYGTQLRSERQYRLRTDFDSHDHSMMSGPVLTRHIEDDAENHQVFFRISEGLDMSVVYDDKDCNGNPLGIRTTLSTGQPSTGTLTITLLHGPDKFADGVSDGDITNAGGLVDFECTFDVEIH